MSMQNNCLFVGRFQPFHNGHLMVVKGMVKTCGKVIILVGSAQESRTERNPFTVAERREMIQRALQGVDIIPRYDVEIREIDDMESDEEWTEAVIEKCGPLENVWTGDPWTKKCFEAKDVEVKEISEVPGISATEVRKRIRENDGSWKDLVPEEVATYIGEIDGTSIVRKA